MSRPTQSGIGPHSTGPEPTPTSPDPDLRCPQCLATEGIRPLPSPNPERTQAWTCQRCGTNWAVSQMTPNPHGYVRVADLGVMLRRAGRQRWLLDQLVKLAGQESTLTDEQLRSRLRALAEMAGPGG